MTAKLAAACLLALPALASANPEAEVAAAEAVAPVLITGAMLGTAIVIVSIVLYARHRAAELRHATIRLLVEKGQPVPPALLAPVRAAPDPARDLRRGLQLVGLGAGVGLFLLSIPDARVAAGLGLVPGLLGLGSLSAWWLEGRDRRAARAADAA